jgi:hypothetical protein
MSATFTPNPQGDWSQAFARAEAYLAKGKSKTDRPLGSTKRLARVDEDTITVVLHNTAIVTYHRDGTFTIYGGGWNTVTTKAMIRTYSPVSIWSHNGEWIVGDTGERTPARVQKCRSCKGRGRWMEADYCYGRTYWGPDGNYLSTPAPCEHGNTERHQTGESERACYRCNGAGRVDYGSKLIPVTVTASQAYRVDASGTFLGTTDAPYAPCNGYAKSTKTSYPAPYPFPSTPAPSPHNVGASLVDSLATVLPNVRAQVVHPTTGWTGALNSTIVELNDTQQWSRERIADWLESLDLDLRFPADSVGTD